MNYEKYKTKIAEEKKSEYLESQAESIEIWQDFLMSLYHYVAILTVAILIFLLSVVAVVKVAEWVSARDSE